MNEKLNKTRLSFVLLALIAGLSACNKPAETNTESAAEVATDAVEANTSTKICASFGSS